MQDSLHRFKDDWFHALAHPTRNTIVENLRVREMPASKPIELGLDQADASQHRMSRRIYRVPGPK
jgi:ArsR family transcriptional regulator